MSEAVRVLLALLGALLGLAGCSFSPTADVVKALAGDPATICWKVTTPWGSSSLDRYHGCEGNAAPGVTAVIAPGSMEMTLIKP